jgi:RNA polymerase sigma factor (sigma-70 family)
LLNFTQNTEGVTTFAVWLLNVQFSLKKQNYLNPITEKPFLDDADLVQLYRKSGDVQHLGTLFKRYSGLILGVCMKYLKHHAESEDAVMEIFEKLHLDLKRVEIDYFRGWLYTVARNHCLMKLRKAGLDVEFPEDLPPIAATEDEFDIEKEASLQQLEQALPHLKEEQKLCVELFYLQEKSYKEVALETGFTLNEVKTHIQNGKLNLKKLMFRT